jgi:hypothetical protein
MSITKPKIEYSEIYLANPKDILAHKVRSFMADLEIKKSHNIDVAPQYYTGVAMMLENTFLAEVASTTPVSKQMEGYGDYDG